MIDPSRYELEFDEQFDGHELDLERWLPHYLPHWSSREATRARYEVGGGALRLRIEDDQPPWSPEFNGGLRVSGLQTGVYAGPLGSRQGQHRFRDDLVVREEQLESRLYLPQFGRVEIRARAPRHPRCMVALWLIGFEDEPRRSGEICIMEIFGSELASESGLVGMGVHPFGDPALVDDFAKVRVTGDLTQPHTYAAEWDEQHVDFLVDGVLVKSTPQALQYPMQLMLTIYEFPDDGTGEARVGLEKVFVVDHVRGWRRSAG